MIDLNTPPRQRPHVSVIIPTFGRPRSCLKALSSALEQRAEAPYEVLVVDNACDADLRSCVDGLAARANGRVVYVAEPAVGLHNARHAAVKHAQGEILAFIDDDVLVAAGWLQAVSDAFVRDDIWMVCGPIRPAYEVDPPDWLEAFWTRQPGGESWCDLLTLLDLGDDALEIDPGFVWGANFSIRRQSLLDAGGFHPDGFPWGLRRFRGDGETAVSRAVAASGGGALYVPGVSVEHIIPGERMTMPYLERRCYLQGVSDSFTDCRASRRAPWSHRNRLATTARAGLGGLRRGLRLGAAAKDAGNVLPLRRIAARHHHEGYRWHQACFARDHTLRQWVLREDFWEAPIPDGDEAASGLDRHL